MNENFSLIAMCVFLLGSLAFLAEQITAYHWSAALGCLAFLAEQNTANPQRRARRPPLRDAPEAL